MTACEQCWSKAYGIAVRTGQHQADVYRELVRQPRSHPHGLPPDAPGDEEKEIEDGQH